MTEEYSDKILEEISKKAQRWSDEFSKSRYYEGLTEEQKQESEFVITSFTEYMYSYHCLRPEEWNEFEIEECCLYTLPRKVVADESCFRSIAPVLVAFFDFLGEKKILKDAQQLKRVVEKIGKQIIKNAKDPKNWGIGKSLSMDMKEAGVDITNEQEIADFITVYNQKMLSEQKNKPSRTSRTEKQKIRRNDPCHCGSGKKYKKCCGK